METYIVVGKEAIQGVCMVLIKDNEMIAHDFEYSSYVKEDCEELFNPLPALPPMPAINLGNFDLWNGDYIWYQWKEEFRKKTNL